MAPARQKIDSHHAENVRSASACIADHARRKSAARVESMIAHGEERAHRAQPVPERDVRDTTRSALHAAAAWLHAEDEQGREALTQLVHLLCGGRITPSEYRKAVDDLKRARCAEPPSEASPGKIDRSGGYWPRNGW